MPSIETVRIRFSEEEEEAVRIAAPLYAHWKLYSQEPLRIRLGHRAIIADARPSEPPLLFRKENNNEYFKELMSALRDEPGLCFLFNREDIDWSALTVTGVFLADTPDGERQWHRFTVPFPEVVYNRQAYRLSFRRPIQYAIHLIDRRKRGFPI